jgi:methyl halide transferase
MSRDPTLTIQNFFKQSQDIPVNAKWDTLWQNNQTPWDRGGSSPALEELVVDKKFPLVPRGGAGRALVPGCGRGYDVALFASLKGDDQQFEKVVGLDVSPKALGEARKLHVKENIEFLEGDFFSETDDWAKLAPYDVVYDYTVLFPVLLG